MKADFYDWKRHPVTLEVFQQLEDRMKYATEVLVANAGIDTRADAWHAGAIQAYRDLLNIEYEGEDSSGN